MEEQNHYTDNTTWKIWFMHYDINGNIFAYGVHRFVYTRKSSAIRRAKQLWGNNPMVKWTVSKTNPWKKGETKNEN